MSSESQSAGPLGNHRLTLENVPAREGSPFTWGDIMDTLEGYRDKNSDRWLVFIKKRTGEFSAAPYSHRFQKEYSRMQYAKMQDFVRGARGEYDDPHLVLLTFSATTTKPNGEPRPPLDHMDEVLGSWGDGVYYELNRVMEGDRKRDPWEPRPDWEYLSILEPTTDDGYVNGGYAHVHVPIVVDGGVSEERFESVIDRHVAECPGAGPEAHAYEKAIDVRPLDDLDNPGAYLFKYLGKSWDPEDMEDYERRFAALLFDQERQRFRASNGAQRWMKRDEGESESGDYIFAGVGDGDRVFQLLREYDDLQDFRMAREDGLSEGESAAGGVRAYLNRRGGADESEDSEPEPLQVTHEEFHAEGYEAGRPLPRGGGNGPVGDRPPP